MAKMKLSEVYRRAAEYMESPDSINGICWALAVITKSATYDTQAHKFFNLYFQHWKEGQEFLGLERSERKGVRVMALLLLSRIAASEGK
jgi:hypothetical protein